MSMWGELCKKLNFATIFNLIQFQYTIWGENMYLKRNHDYFVGCCETCLTAGKQRKYLCKILFCSTIKRMWHEILIRVSFFWLWLYVTLCDCRRYSVIPGNTFKSHNRYMISKSLLSQLHYLSKTFSHLFPDRFKLINQKTSSTRDCVFCIFGRLCVGDFKGTALSFSGSHETIFIFIFYRSSRLASYLTFYALRH